MELFHHCLEIATREFPLEGRSDVLIVLLEAEESVFDFRQGAEVVGGERLAFNDGEVDFDLIEPAGVDRSMHGDEIGEGGLEAPNTALAAMRRAVVHDPEYAPGAAIRWLRHDLGNQAMERLDAGGRLAAAEEFRAMNVHRGQIGPGAAPRVLVLDTSGLSGTGRQGGMLSKACLDAGLLVGGEHKLVVAQRMAFPVPGVEVQDTAGFGDELWIARENPAAMLPGANRILMEPTPNGLGA